MPFIVLVIDEFADLFEVLDALRAVQNISTKDLEQARIQNRKEKGKFAKRLFLQWSTDASYKSNETPQGIKR